MIIAPSAQLVTRGQRLATSASKFGRIRLTFMSLRGLTPDGHERSMAGTDSAACCRWGKGRGV